MQNMLDIILGTHGNLLETRSHAFSAKKSRATAMRIFLFIQHLQYPQICAPAGERQANLQKREEHEENAVHRGKITPRPMDKPRSSAAGNAPKSRRAKPARMAH